jgi:GNAT superfamily N-acetyltransferase
VSDIKIAEETSIATFIEAYALAKAHYEEVEDKDIDFKFDLELMQKYLDLGLVYVITARKGGLLIGYFANFVGPDIFTSKIIAKELGIYLTPKYRGGRTFLRMLKAVEDEAKERGAYSQLIMFKKGHDSGLAPRLGYEHTETVYQKVMEN